MPPRGLNGAAVALLCLVGALGVALADQPQPQPSSVRPGINRAYQAPDFAQWVRRFERPGREVYDRRHAIVAATGVGPGMAVADVGAGTGLFTRLFAEAVGPNGTVYAVDISDVFVRNVLARGRARGQTNVTGVVNDPRDVALPARSVDLVFICATYHHFEYPHAMLASIHRALRPGAALVVIDFRKREGASSPWVMSHVRAGKHRVIEEITAAGFELTEDRDVLGKNFFLRFRKASRPRGPRSPEPGP